MIARWLERGGGTETAVAAKPEGYEIMIVAEKYGVLPDDVENRMSDYWFSRAWEYIEAESIVNRNREEKFKKTHGRK